jgi:hypothetical protein
VTEVAETPVVLLEERGTVSLSHVGIFVVTPSFGSARPPMPRWLWEKGTIEMPTAKLTMTIIEAAINGFEAKKKSIDAQIAELRAMLTGAPEGSVEAAPTKRKRRKFSAAAIKRMREAQRLRWAKIKGKSKAAPEAKAAKTTKPKPHFSAAARKALSEAMKKRWAAKRAASGQAAPAAKKAARRKAA